MDQHPVPQNITSYEFRLVGDMTLKQFFQLAGGGIVGVIIYQLPLPFFVKWPLIFVAVGIGAALAFVPVQGRPFSQWLTAFFGAIYAPTEYYWSPTSNEQIVQSSEKSISTNYEPRANNLIDQFETQFLGKVTQMFSTSPSTTVGTNSPVVAATIPEEQFHVADVVSKPMVKQEPIQTIEVSQAKDVPTQQGVSIQELGASNVVYETQTQIVVPQAAPQAVPALTTNLIPEPSYPNILTGLIKDPTDISLEGAIVEIVDSATGIPARALRTNKLGQFQIATPLSNGSYTIIVDKQGFSFNPVLVQAEGTIIKPILIKAS